MAKMNRSQQKKRVGTLALFMLALLSLLLLVFLLVGLVAVPSSPDSQLRNGAKLELKLPLSQLHVHQGESGSKPWVEVLSWEPRAFLYHKFLTPEECTHLIDLAKPSMIKSTVVDSATGKSKDSRVRTSSGTFLTRGQDKIIQTIEQRIADFTFIPVDHGEGLQVLHYEVGQKYEAHYDYFHDTFNTKNGGQRIATVLMYLSDVEAGGETVFPASQVNSSLVPHWDELTECAKAGLSVQPHMGDALLFWSMKPDATLDTTSLHGGCPVVKGNKWSATKWLHVDQYSVPS
ncbi:hypothetical protein BDL97_15G036000 [Sphagnum fallax]|nr:hypothetical protein BDL97_15G036000 [Sphagnum fallax]KAH8939418.1 hypothetical protein BDL97_15G036000 [Sphagnum fallax]